MNELDVLFAEVGRPALNGQFGVAAVYTAPDGTATACTIRRKPLDPSTVSEQGVTRTAQRSAISCDAAEVDQPVMGGRFTFDGEVWTIDAAPWSQHGGHACECVRASEPRHGRKGNGNGNTF